MMSLELNIARYSPLWDMRENDDETEKGPEGQKGVTPIPVDRVSVKLLSAV